MKTIIFCIIFVSYININAQLGYYSSIKNDEISPSFFIKYNLNHYSCQINLPFTIINKDYYNNNKRKVSIYSIFPLGYLAVAGLLGESGAMRIDSGLGRILFITSIVPLLVINSQHHINLFPLSKDSLNSFNISAFIGSQYDSYIEGGKYYDDWSRLSVNTGIELFISFYKNPREKSFIGHLPCFAIQGGISKYWDINNGAKNPKVTSYGCIKLYFSY